MVPGHNNSELQTRAKPATRMNTTDLRRYLNRPPYTGSDQSRRLRLRKPRSGRSRQRRLHAGQSRRTCRGRSRRSRPFQTRSNVRLGWPSRSCLSRPARTLAWTLAVLPLLLLTTRIVQSLSRHSIKRKRTPCPSRPSRPRWLTRPVRGFRSKPTRGGRRFRIRRQPCRLRPSHPRRCTPDRESRSRPIRGRRPRITGNRGIVKRTRGTRTRKNLSSSIPRRRPSTKGPCLATCLCQGPIQARTRVHQTRNETTPKFRSTRIRGVTIPFSRAKTRTRKRRPGAS
mmetsp:Transcript_482/g.1635  ORF Transcript_482/g.1635 Transcript_482/m.1635 type:complete len:284 (+) Transcript_482:1674-2525(+)